MPIHHIYISTSVLRSCFVVEGFLIISVSSNFSKGIFNGKGLDGSEDLDFDIFISSGLFGVRSCVSWVTEGLCIITIHCYSSTGYLEELSNLSR